MALLTPAQLTWRDDQAYASDYDDIYSSKDAQAEVMRNFIAPCGLDAALPETLTVGELGFGTGLNFAVLAERVIKQPNARLHFVSFERHPLSQADWLRAAAQRRDLSVYQTLERDPLPLLSGWQRRVFADGRIKLSVFHGDVLDGLAQLAERSFDAWFLDGFAPSKNPDMWSPVVMAGLAEHSHQGTQLATFTVAGHVRRGLEAAGFTVSKIDQRPHKRESIKAVFPSGRPRQKTGLREALIFGGGIGGACLARHLAEAGTDVHLCDPNGIASGASSMPQVVLHARLLGDGSTSAELRAQAFHYATHFYNRYHENNNAPGGVLQVQGPNLDADKLTRIATSYDAQKPEQAFWIQKLAPNAASELSGVPIPTASLFFPTARALALAPICQALLDHPNIEVHSAPPKIKTDTPQILCAGSASRELALAAEHLEIKDVFGQLNTLRYSDVKARLPIVGNGYCVPIEGGAVIGSTYEHSPWETERATEHNLALNAAWLPTDYTQGGHARQARCISSDRLALVGHLTENIWIATAFGSMGATLAPFAAAIVASQLLDEVVPGTPGIAELINPQRFAERQARRGRRFT